MPRSPTPTACSAGSSSRFVDRRGVIDELRQLCRRARQQRPDIESVVLFGSYARGSCGPRSDADLFVVLADSPHARRMDRIPDLLRVFAPTPVPLDIVPWTRAELEQARQRGDRWVAMVQRQGIELL